MPRVICAGHVNWDVTLRIDRLPDADGEACITEQRQSGGGSASNAAVVLAGLDVSTGLLGSVGRDKNGWLARRELEESGVDTTLVESRDHPTSVKYLVVDEDGELIVLGNDGANEAFAPDDLPPEALTETAHLHLTGQSPATATALAERATAAGVPVSFDPGRRFGERDFEATLEHVDTLFCNDREADVTDAADFVGDVSTVVVKRGSGGAEVQSADGTITHPGFAVDPVDTSGAGDAFAAGYIAGQFDGTDEYALAVANACGALAARKTGARLRVGWRDVEALLDIGPVDRDGRPVDG